MKEFTKMLEGPASFFGFREETMPSLLLAFLPGQIKEEELHKELHVTPISEDSLSSTRAFLLNGVISILHQVGFQSVPVSLYKLILNTALHIALYTLCVFPCSVPLRK